MRLNNVLYMKQWFPGRSLAHDFQRAFVNPRGAWNLLRRSALLAHHASLPYAEVMRSAIALNASFFNSARMVDQYVQNAYLSGTHPVG